MSKKENFPFTAELIGSEILARFSEDIYTPKAIIRELVKNAYDSYFELEHHLESISHDLDVGEREVRVVVVDKDVIISDDGLGLDFAAFTRLISIALTDKRGLDGVSGFRGIGFWSAYTGGDQIVVESTRFGSNKKFTLTLNTKRMRSLQGPNISIGKMMNDPECMNLVSDPARADEHFTKVLVRAESDEARLKSLIAKPDQLRAMLLEGCSCPLTDKTPMHAEVSRFYNINTVRSAKLLFQGQPVTKAIPDGLVDFDTRAIEVTIQNKRQVVAQIWYATNAQNARLETLPGLRLFRDSFPVGTPNLYSDRSLTDSLVEITRRDLLDWHTGEVHLLHDALKPDASGEHVRDSALLVHFREELRKFYEKLIETSYAKQRRKSVRSEYTKFADKVAAIVAKVQAKEPLAEADQLELKEISAIVERDNGYAKQKSPTNSAAGSREMLVREDEVKKKRRQITKLLKDLPTQSGGKTTPAARGAAKKAETKASSEDGRRATTASSEFIARSSVVAAIDDVRDAVLEVLKDETALQKDLLSRINVIAKRL